MCTWKFWHHPIRQSLREIHQLAEVAEFFQQSKNLSHPNVIIKNLPFEINELIKNKLIWFIQFDVCSIFIHGELLKFKSALRLLEYPQLL